MTARTAEHLQATRERVLAAVTTAPLAGRVEAALVGVSFIADYPAGLRAVAAAMEARLFDPDGPVEPEPVPAVLLRNPANDHDTNAIEVWVAVRSEPEVLGHLPRALARRLAPELDAGVEWAAAVVAVRVLDGFDNPGADVSLERAGAPR